MKKEIKKKITIEDLAVIVGKGFNGVNDKFKEVHKKMDKNFSDVNVRFKNVHDKIDKGFSDVDKKFKNVHDEFKNVHKKMDIGFSDVRKEMEDLAVMTGRGFEGVDKRFNELDLRLSAGIGNVEEKLSRKIDGLSNRTDDLSLNRATREELKILSIRVDKVEEKVFPN